VGAAGALIDASVIEPVRLRLTEKQIPLAGLPGSFDGYRIAHISDIHMDSWMTGARLLSIVQRVNALDADAIVITGDFVSHDQQQRDARGERTGDAVAHFAPGLGEGLRQLRARDGVFAVSGNHDHWTSIESVRAVLHSAGVRQLDNAVAPVVRGAGRVWLCGVDDAWAGKPDLPGVVAELASTAHPQEVAIMLSHAPDFGDQVVETARFALQLSGHSHGGQVSLPLIGPPLLPRLGRKYHTGLYDVLAGNARLWQFTTRGVGMLQPRVRFNCPSEIALLTLRDEKAVAT
jgi:predicted MPP superfamily phosphohydrolase